MSDSDSDLGFSGLSDENTDPDFVPSPPPPHVTWTRNSNYRLLDSQTRPIPGATGEEVDSYNDTERPNLPSPSTSGNPSSNVTIPLSSPSSPSSPGLGSEDQDDSFRIESGSENEFHEPIPSTSTSVTARTNRARGGRGGCGYGRGRGAGSCRGKKRKNVRPKKVKVSTTGGRKRKIVRKRVIQEDTAEFEEAITECKFKCALHLEKDGSSLVRETAYEIGQFELSILGTDLMLISPEVSDVSQGKHKGDFTSEIISVLLNVSDIPTRTVLSISRTKTLESAKCSLVEFMLCYYFVDTHGLDHNLWKGFAQRSRCPLRLDIIEFHKESRSLVLSAKILDSGFYDGENDIPRKVEFLSPIAKVVKHFLKIEDESSNETNVADKKEDLPWIYSQLKKYHASETIHCPSYTIQNKYLAPTLREYQKQAIIWMLNREGCIPNQSIQTKPDLTELILGLLFVPIQLGRISHEGEANIAGLNEPNAFFNVFGGYFCWKLPQLPPMPLGGILADEMGLGKTVEVLALILLNPRKDLPKQNNEMVQYQPHSLKQFKADSTSSSEDEEDFQTKAGKNKRKMSWKSMLLPRTKHKHKRIMIPENTKKTTLKRKPEQDRLEHPKLKYSRGVSTSEFMTHGYGSGSNDQSESSTCPQSAKAEASGNLEDTDGGRKCPRLKPFDESSDSDVSYTNNKPTEGSSVSATTSKFLSGRNNAWETTKYASTTESSNDSTCQVAQSTYSRVKVMYDAALQPYSSSKDAVVTKKFNGQFFDPNVGTKAYFECLCGKVRGKYNPTVVVCIKCNSSQHVDCVRYNRMINGVLDRASYYCPPCTAIEEPIQSKTTLIITPATISLQWIQEIKRHVRGKHLNILLYKGVSRQEYIPPHELAKYDIIISTYAVLATELTHADLPHTNSSDGRRFRKAKRFLPIPSPLVSVVWWRICLDEAQMVESGITKVANMARRLKGVYKWCITGTPINKGLKDLYGLMAFLGVHPLDEETWWTCLVSEPFYKKDFTFLNELFGQLIWRTGKNEVLDQLGVPAQTEMVHVLKFSALEKHFYNRQLELCGKTINSKIARLGLDSLDVKLSSLNRLVLNNLLRPLLELRQACVHPQMVRGESLNLNKDGNMTMEELLEQLIRKSVVQCADDLRAIIASMNGIASINCIIERWEDASDKYREVLQLAEKYEANFSTDSLQLLHALENLADILDMRVAGVGVTLLDDTLRDRASDIRKKYLEKYAAGVIKAREAGVAQTLIVEDVTKSLVSDNNSSWFAKVLVFAHKKGKHDQLLSIVKEDLKAYASKRKNSGSMANLFKNLSGLEQVLIGKVTEIESMRGSVLLSLEDLETRDASSFVNAAVACHLRGQDPGHRKKYSMCNLCTYYQQFLTYESMLFAEEVHDKVIRTGRNRQKQNIKVVLTKEQLELELQREQEELFQTTEHVTLHAIQRRGTWADSDMEKALKLLLNFAKLNSASPQVIEAGKVHIKLLDATKKELKVLRILWQQIFNQVSAMDELSQATTRLRLRSEYEIDDMGPSSSVVSRQAQRELKSGRTEQLERLQNIHLLEKSQLDYKLQEMIDEHANSTQILAIHYGQLLYLDSLKRNGYGRNGSLNADECPICTIQLGYEWGVLICGHSFCMDCVRKMTSSTSQSFLCPLCRFETNMRKVSFVDTRGTSADDNDGPSTSNEPKVKVEVKGSHSTKVEAIIEKVIKLQDTHPGEKILIFSTWVDMLTIIGRAMDQNDIKYTLLNVSEPSKFQVVLDKFKKREEVQVLLMKLSSGSKGLNIVEATHVFLVEPILNLASELQAIGRVHRIGQTRRTYVHRFYVRDTIEEQLHNILRNQDVSLDEEGSLTVAELKNLVTRN